MAGTVAAQSAPLTDTQKAIAKAEKSTKLEVTGDKFDGRQWVSPKEKLPPNLPGLGLENTVYVEPAYFVLPNGKRGYFLRFDAWLSDWAFFDGSVDLLVDGKAENFKSPDDPKTDVRDRGGVRETFAIWLSDSLLRHLGDAQHIEVRLTGRRYSITSEFRPETIAQLRRLREAPSLTSQSATDSTSQKP